MAYENDDYRKMKAACEYWARVRTLIDKAREIETMKWDDVVHVVSAENKFGGEGRAVELSGHAKNALIEAMSKYYTDQTLTMLGNPPEAFDIIAAAKVTG